MSNIKQHIGPRKRPPLELILRFYDAWVREANFHRAAAALGCNRAVLSRWCDKYPEFKLAKEMAEKNAGNRENLAEYVVGHLSPEARELWNKLQFWDNHRDMDGKVAQLTAYQPKKIKQELYLHALIRSHFDPSSAMRITGVSHLEVNRWKTDPDFKKLFKEIQWHKKNFFEKALMTLVEEKHPGAVIFVNKTINADRGYSEKLEVKHTGQIDVTSIDVDDLDLSLATRREILDAIRRKKESVKAAPKGEIVDVEEVKMLEAPVEEEIAA